MKRIGLLLFALLLALSFGAMAGHNWASPGRLAAAFSGDTSLQSQLLMVWRLPRVLAAALVGALLGLGGAIFQGVFRNPLAEPYLLGSSGGAAIGATVALLVPLGLPAGPALAGLSFLVKLRVPQIAFRRLEGLPGEQDFPLCFKLPENAVL